LPDGRPIAPVWLDLPEARLYGEWRRPAVPGRPTVVVLHDGLGCTMTVRDFPDRLGEALGVGAFVYDRWGYGRSDRRAAFPFRFMEEEADRLPRVLDAAGIADCVLVGHSDGGTIALLHAAANPTRLRAVATVAAHVFLDRLTRRELERHQRMVEDGSIPEFMFRFHGARGPHVLWCWTSLWREERYRDWHIGERIRSIRGPLLAVQGATDAYGVPEQIEIIQASVPHARTLLLPGVGHFPHIENPDLATRTIADFLAPYCG
jgi:pimeloyl-ACP methyl ester carboxylesterase